MIFRNKVILSFDYELFFGDQSGTVQKSLIEPTNKLLDCMDSVGFKGNFFVDWLMLKYLKKENCVRTLSDYTMIENQLKDMILRGHRIELHLHPHWIDAKYKKDGTWEFSNFSHYSLNMIPTEELTQMFIEGTDLLTSIARQVNPSYRICAFRAGGWAIQPFDKVREGFLKSGILIDSSVMFGIGVKTYYSDCDFTNVSLPIDGYYYFESDVCIENKKGAFIEIPISSCERNFGVKVISKLARLLRVSIQPETDGSHDRANTPKDIWMNPYGLGVFTFSNITPFEIIMRQLTSNSLTCYIEHPKDFTKYSLLGIKALSMIRKSVLYSDILDSLR